MAEPLGKAEALLSDNGYYSEASVKACAEEKITPFIAAGREGHHLTLEQRWSGPPPLAPEANAVQAMKHPLGDTRRPGHLRATQMYGGTGVWDHQIGDGVSSVSPPRAERGLRRMDAGEYGLECEEAVQPEATVWSAADLQQQLHARRGPAHRANDLVPAPNRYAQAPNRPVLKTFFNEWLEELKELT